MFQWISKKNKKRVYLDYAAATPVSTEVLAVMAPYWREDFANPSAIHAAGKRARGSVEGARAALARLLRLRADDILFTGSGTESNNLALLGLVAEKVRQGTPYTQIQVLTTEIEHASVLRVFEHLATLGVCVSYVPVSTEGQIDQQALAELVSPQTLLLATSYVNSEIGVIAPLTQLARILRKKEKEFGTRIYLVADAAQAPLWLPCAIDSLGVDILTLDAGKCHGPKGVGVLAKRHDVTLAPIIFGGGQEHGLRPATENVPLILGATHALLCAQEDWADRAQRVQALRDVFIQTLLSIEGVVVNGSLTERVPNNVHISIEGVESEYAVVCLSQQGIACATKSACGGARGDGSAVVRTLYNDPARARTTIRFTLGATTTAQELAYTVEKLRAHVEKVRTWQNRLTKT